ncbi:cyclic nucleotide-binding domain-containing protein [Halioxenophilus sp. WMMB6]|uniref:cyclic nucleotide-binding domain-containing protein n=1 Tax=Halioxenophilus sp. WMMB6 TaxID=3073815 RepID=UPI00295E389F|nr:cyclic nucleotide-binding domain-containing protein [Halioxenophilus sp. WMMB6]
MNGKIDSVSSFVPLQGIPEQHLSFLLNKAHSRFLFKGSSLKSQNLGLESYIYLFSGEVIVRTFEGEERVRATENLLPIAYQQYHAVEITAVMDSELLIFPAQELKQQLCWSQMAEFQRVQIAGDPTRDEDAEWINFILDSNLFFKVPPTNVSEIFSKLTPRVVSSGDVIVRQGDVGNACYFIKEGRAKVEVADVDADMKKVVAEIGPGRCFGEDALVNKTQRNATVSMIENGVLMRLSKDDFLPLLKRDQATTVDLDYLLAKLGQDEECIIIDVRTVPEYQFGHLETAVNIALDILPLHLPRLNNRFEYILYSDCGFRSNAGAVALSKLGYNAVSLEGGLSEIYTGCSVNPKLKQLLTISPYWVRGGYVVSDQPVGATKYR